MTTAVAPRDTRLFAERAEALAFFFRAAGSAPRLMALDDGAGCPLFHALAALQWTLVTELIAPTDRLHAVWFSLESAAAVIERRSEEGGVARRVYRYLGPQQETPQKTPIDGTQVVDERFIRGFEFTERWSAVAHFLVTTQGKGSLLALLAAHAPEVEAVRRWTTSLFAGPAPEGADHLHAAWFTTTGAGFLFPPAAFTDDRSRGWAYVELGEAEGP